MLALGSASSSLTAGSCVCEPADVGRSEPAAGAASGGRWWLCRSSISRAAFSFQMCRLCRIPASFPWCLVSGTRCAARGGQIGGSEGGPLGIAVLRCLRSCSQLPCALFPTSLAVLTGHALLPQLADREAAYRSQVRSSCIPTAVAAAARNSFTNTALPAAILTCCLPVVQTFQATEEERKRTEAYQKQAIEQQRALSDSQRQVSIPALPAAPLASLPSRSAPAVVA